MTTTSSLYGRYIDRPRSKGAMVVIAVVLLLLPLVAVALDSLLPDFFSSGVWRIYYLPVIMILYVLLIVQPLSHSNETALQAFRSVVQLDDEAFQRVLQESSQIKPAYELISIGAGILLGLLSVTSWGIGPGFSWSKLYLYLAVCAMYALLLWTLLISILWTRLTKALHNQPLKFDLFDTQPFEPVGRQSLIIALVIIGGVSISLLFTFQPSSLRIPFFWVVHAILVLIPIVIFFMSMRPTHTLLSNEKKRQLERVQRLILENSRELVRRIEEEDPGERHAETAALSAELRALAVYEVHIQDARTWPYNIIQLRTLFFSVLIPIITMFAKVIAEFLK
jgi:hypothetical protein